MKFKNPENNHIESISAPWLWSLLFGPIYLLVSGLWAMAIVWFVLAVLSLALFGAPGIVVILVINLVNAILVSGMIKGAYLRKGWKEIDDASGLAGSSSDEKKCPACAEFIKVEAKICRYCSHVQPEVAERPQLSQDVQLMAQHGVQLLDGKYFVGVNDFVTLKDAIGYSKTMAFAQANNR